MNEQTGIFDNALWSLCGVQFPPKTCKNHGLTFDAPNTTNHNREFFFFIALCPTNGPGQIYVNMTLKEKRCSEINFDAAKFIVTLCSLDSSGVFCGQLAEPLASLSQVSAINVDVILVAKTTAH